VGFFLDFIFLEN